MLKKFPIKAHLILFAFCSLILALPMGAFAESGSEDNCSGTCVPTHQCAPADQGTLKDGTGQGTCEKDLYFCCTKVIVTPEGEAPGSLQAEEAVAESADADEQKDQQVGSACREKSTGLNFPCIMDGSPSAVITAIVARVINWVLSITGVLFLVMFIWGGLLYMTAGGDEGKAKKGRTTLVNAVIGTIIVMGSYVILDYIFSSFISAAGF
jgi:Type IV secretion system pilin